ncbi:PepSY domain-containing protein [Bacillus sp. P2(2020)]|uniref:PepSY domain-containing protein n=2 Tax=Calidifontibacillus erzurumensis TaxID=2741433 RepID=A0A8J8GK56_9BACI|nr:PepSY domain-containing protein [Calidifontibacillus erzurumensis]NSL53263.1 PepSY domain-containing protein [Calidifontibacillus erzurumensis]
MTPVYRQRITKEQAQEIALSHVPGEILHVDMDLENGVLVYEVFILTQDNRIIEVEILAKSGRVLKIEQENDFD